MIEIVKALRESKYPVVEFNFHNSGHGEALIRQFNLHVHSYAVDQTPVLRWSAHVDGKTLVISAHNVGWGPATNVQVELRGPFASLFPKGPLRLASSIFSGKTERVSSIGSSGLLGRSGLDRIKFNELLSHQKEAASKKLAAGGQGHFCRDFFGEVVEPGAEELLIETLSFDVSFEDADDKSHVMHAEAKLIDEDSYIVLTKGGFEKRRRHRSMMCASMAMPESLYYVAIDKAKIGSPRTYKVSHTIAPGAVENFHIMLGSERSARSQLHLEFVLGHGSVISSERFDVTFRTSVDDWHYNRYIDGDELITTGSFPPQGGAEDPFADVRAARRGPRARTAPEVNFPLGTGPWRG